MLNRIAALLILGVPVYAFALLVLWFVAPAKKRSLGVALIEASISTAIVLAIVGLYFSSQGESLESARQKRSVADLRNLGAALNEYRARHGGYPVGTFQEAARVLMQEGIVKAVPLADGWKTPYDYRVTGMLSTGVASHYELRSAGADAVLELRYTPGPFEPTDYGSDIVIADTLFVRWPQSRRSRAAR
ncbi:MAG: type II secretion system protein GspG [Acidobacteriota bacterium]